MNELEAINILTDLANRALKAGVYNDIQDSGSVYTALLLLSRRIPKEQLKQAPTTEPDKE